LVGSAPSGPVETKAEPIPRVTSRPTISQFSRSSLVPLPSPLSLLAMLQNRRLIWPSYLVAFTFAVIPPIDALMQTMPIRFGDTRWRWGAFGLLSNAMMMPMIGLLIAFLVATVFEHRVFQRILGALSTALAVGALAGLGMFALDTLQLHKDVKPAMALAFNVACATAGTKALVGILTLVGFAWATFTGPKPKTQAARNGMMIGGTRHSKPTPPVASPPVASAPVASAPVT
jgi:hypothetical protein